MSHDVEISYLLTLETEQMGSKLRQLETLGFRTLHMLEKLGLPPDAAEAVNEAQRLISTLRMLQLTMNQVEIAAGPIGWLIAGVSVASTALSVGDLIYDEVNGRS
jgi:hypothetical protein